MDHPGFTLRFQLRTQVAHVDLHHIGGAFEIHAPDTIQDNLARKYLARSTQEEREQLVFGRREIYFACATIGYTRAGIQFNVSITQHFVALFLVASQQSLDAYQQFLRRKWFDQVIVASRLEPFYPVSN